MKKGALAGAVLSVVTLTGTALAQPLTLSECIRQGMTHSPELAALQHDIAAAGYQITKQRGTTLPFLSSELNAYEVNGAPVTPFSTLNLSSPENPITTSLNAHWDPVAIQTVTATYPLYMYGSLMGLNHPPVVAAAEAQLSEQQLAIILAQQKVVLDIFTAYSQAVWYRRAAAIDRTIIKLAEQELDIIRDEVALGMKIPQTIDLARAELEAGQEAEASARQNTASATSELATFMGRGSDAVLELSDHKPPLPPLEPLNEFLARTLPNHPATKIQGYKVEIAKQQLRVDRANILPTVSLNNSLMAGEDLEYINGNHQHRSPTNFLAYLQVDVPIYDFGERRAAIDESGERVSSAKQVVHQIEFDLRKSITQNYEAIKDLDAQTAMLHKDFIGATNDVELARAERIEGMVDQLALVQAELALRYVQVSLEYNQYQQGILYAQLQNLSAGAWRWIQ